MSRNISLFERYNLNRKGDRLLCFVEHSEPKILMKKKYYRFGLNHEKHQDVIESIEEVPRPLRGEYIAAAIRILQKTNITKISNSDNSNKGVSDVQAEEVKAKDSGLDFKDAFSF